MLAKVVVVVVVIIAQIIAESMLLSIPLNILICVHGSRIKSRVRSETCILYNICRWSGSLNSLKFLLM